MDLCPQVASSKWLCPQQGAVVKGQALSACPSCPPRVGPCCSPRGAALLFLVEPDLCDQLPRPFALPPCSSGEKVPSLTGRLQVPDIRGVTRNGCPDTELCVAQRPGAWGTLGLEGQAGARWMEEG